VTEVIRSEVGFVTSGVAQEGCAADAGAGYEDVEGRLEASKRAAKAAIDGGSMRSIGSISTPSSPSSVCRASKRFRAGTTTDAPAPRNARTVSTPMPGEVDAVDHFLGCRRDTKS
jgi:hypothetical protein